MAQVRSAKIISMIKWIQIKRLSKRTPPLSHPSGFGVRGLRFQVWESEFQEGGPVRVWRVLECRVQGVGEETFQGLRFRVWGLRYEGVEGFGIDDEN